MAIKIVDGSSVHKNFDGILKSFLPHAQKTLGYDKPVDLQLVSDPKNAKDPFGKTAYYDPNLMRITVFVDKRHVKDILRSISHELVHHKQNCEGRLHAPAGEGYAQNDPHLRELEGEAYLEGNGFLFRDWEDKVKGDKEMREEILSETLKRTIKRIIAESKDFAVAPQLGEDLTDPHVLQGDEDPSDGPGKLDMLRQRLEFLGPDDLAKVMDALEAAGVTSDLSEKHKKDSKDRRPPDTTADRLRPLEEEASVSEAATTMVPSVQKALVRKSARDEMENWARSPLNERIHKELLKRWCK